MQVLSDWRYVAAFVFPIMAVAAYGLGVIPGIGSEASKAEAVTMTSSAGQRVASAKHAGLAFTAASAGLAALSELAPGTAEMRACQAELDTATEAARLAGEEARKAVKNRQNVPQVLVAEDGYRRAAKICVTAARKPCLERMRAAAACSALADISDGDLRYIVELQAE